MQLSSRFASRSPALRSARPLADDEIARVAPSIFAVEPHGSRSERYTYIPTIDVLRGLRKEGFEPFMVVQTRVRNESKREHTKHMIRLRHADQIIGREANEIILLNSHDGSSSYQMLAGMFRFVCQNGMVCGDTLADFRVPHKGDVIGQVIEGAFTVLDSFEAANEQREGMQALRLTDGEQGAFARAALALKYDAEEAPAPISDAQLLTPRRIEDRGSDLWTTFNRVQENLTKGGLIGRTPRGRATRTRPVNGIDQNVKLNRALWVLADELRRLRA
ncbi:DUF932 domain-containing protein [Xanthomonas perforans]|jgi:hypothetical protein|uniref:DUF932 domain-containing protein n=1 Tax=Pseudomonadota TaxID=1224 RepID=UPI000760DC6D|nr:MULTISPECIES: DUF932 domain-containing protein [Pseudomonadota]KWU19066.1 hypothetical protein AS149_12525 [Burkholderia cenocepacia]MCC8508413.1 DUF945 domain-containing protein [Xanthomonas hortorum pv. gardneri]MCC8525760.1 DUF945 domain-containing protein [Xanthomonas hortorum pv. gardneri]